MKDESTSCDYFFSVLVLTSSSLDLSALCTELYNSEIKETKNTERTEAQRVRN